jgi:hypothetical protein
MVNPKSILNQSLWANPTRLLHLDLGILELGILELGILEPDLMYARTHVRLEVLLGNDFEGEEVGGGSAFFEH